MAEKEAMNFKIDNSSQLISVTKKKLKNEQTLSLEG